MLFQNLTMQLHSNKHTNQSINNFLPLKPTQFPLKKLNEQFTVDFVKKININDDNERTFLQIQKQNEKLTKKIKLMIESIEIMKERQKLKAQQLINYEQISQKESQKITKYKSVISEQKQKKKQIKRKIEQILQKIQIKKQQINQQLQIQQMEIQQIQEIKANSQILEQQSQYLSQKIDLNEENIQRFSKQKQVQINLLKKLQQEQKKIKQYQQRNLRKVKQNEQLNKKINNLLKVVNSQSHKNNKSRARIKNMREQDRNMPTQKINQILIDQEKQIKNLQLKMGTLNQQLVYANQKLFELQSSLIYKKSQVGKLRQNLLMYKNQTFGKGIKVQRQNPYIYERNNKEINYNKEIDSKRSKQKEKSQNKVEDPKTQIKPKGVSEYCIIQSDSELKSEQRNKKDNKRVNGSIKSGCQNNKNKSTDNIKFQTHEQMKALVQRYERVKSKSISRQY